jgi:hypothetical protein
MERWTILEIAYQYKLFHVLISLLAQLLQLTPRVVGLARPQRAPAGGTSFGRRAPEGPGAAGRRRRPRARGGPRSGGARGSKGVFGILKLTDKPKASNKRGALAAATVG